MSRMIRILAWNRLVPTKARIDLPMWFRCARASRDWQRPAPQCCFRPRWYSSIDQDRSSNA